jgi:hypothetical protein
MVRVGRCPRESPALLILTTAKIEDFDRFWNTFTTRGAEKRRQHGSKGSHVFRNPNEDDRCVLGLWIQLVREHVDGRSAAVTV